jgi:microcystin-dependent protein
MNGNQQSFPYLQSKELGAVFTWAQQLVTQLNQFVNNLNAGTMPGTVQATAASQIPAGWVACEGQLFSKADSPVLYRAIGDRYAKGDEPETHYRLPDARDRVIRHSEAAYGGEQTRVIGKNHLPAYDLPVTDPGHIHEFTPAAHMHNVTDPQHTHGMAGSPMSAGSQVNVGGGAEPAMVGAGGGTTVQYAGTGVTVDPALADGAVERSATGLVVHSDGGGETFDLVPAFLGLRWIIKT